MKALIQGLIMAAVFVALLFGLSSIPWNEKLSLRAHKKSMETRLGDEIMRTIRREHREVSDGAANQTLDSLLTALCEANRIDPVDIHEHLMHSNQVNAFALPGDHLVVFTGLIKDAKNSGEVMGVLAHEIAHLQEHHLMKTMTQKLGTVFLSGSMGDQAGAVLNTLVTNGFSRSMEADADRKAVEYMARAGVNPKHLSDFFERLHVEKEQGADGMEWLSTHPLSQERAKEVMRLAKKAPVKGDKLMSDSAFHVWQQQIREDDSEHL